MRIARTALLVLMPSLAVSAGAQRTRTFTRADSLRGGNGPARAWWDVTFYDLHVKVAPGDSSISGWNEMAYRVVRVPAGRAEMQIDLQRPLVMDSVVQRGQRLTLRHEGNAHFAQLRALPRVREHASVTVYYHGKPTVAVRPPWDGGFIWRTDTTGASWVATANEGIGASIWWPNKDIPSDEPDSQRVAITVPQPMVNVSNGRLRSVQHHADGTSTWEWFVTRPINNYGIAVNAGSYTHFADVYQGEQGPLTLDYWVLKQHEAAARQQFVQTRSMLSCFEGWFGPYPWYEDGFKLVESPHLGMEHQSAVAYGNGFRNGYLGRDLSGTGRGLQWDFIIIHEAAHEWWANSLTNEDAADMWIHESFANYSENLYTECQQGRDAGREYVVGTRKLIRNDSPIVGTFGVNNPGSGDMYYKGGNMLHTMRTRVNDDAKWRSALRGLQAKYRHGIVSGAEVRSYLTSATGVDLSTLFKQYLNTTQIPVLELRMQGGRGQYRWSNVVDGFDLPLRVMLPSGATELRPTTNWQELPGSVAAVSEVRVPDDYYIEIRVVDAR